MQRGPTLFKSVTGSLNRWLSLEQGCASIIFGSSRISVLFAYLDEGCLLSGKGSHRGFQRVLLL